MLWIDVSGLSAGSPAALVARSSASLPDFVLADRADPRVTVARWHRRNVHLDGPIELGQHLLSYCETGGAVSTIVAGGTTWRAQQHAGSVTFLPAGRYERWQLEAPGEVTHLHLYIEPEALRLARHAGGRVPPGMPLPVPPLVPLLDLRDPWFDAFFRLLVAEYEACRAAAQLAAFDLVDRLAELMLHRLAGLQLRPGAADAGPAARAAPLRPHLLRAVQAHVEQHLHERIGLGELAALASMSVGHFVRAFEEATGATPHRWLLEQRLAAACRRLLHGAERIEDIAHACGFAGAAHFSATFRRHLGMTPSAYRRGS